MKETYYVCYKPNGGVGRVAKFTEDNAPYGYDPDKKDWVYMPPLVKIQNDVTANYEEISKEEAEQLIHDL